MEQHALGALVTRRQRLRTDTPLVLPNLSAQDEGATGDGFAQRLRESDLTAAYFRGWDDPTRHLPMLQVGALACGRELM